jgi:hypothetical protein
LAVGGSSVHEHGKGDTGVDGVDLASDKFCAWQLMYCRLLVGEEPYLVAGHPGDEELSCLLQAMVMLEDAPDNFIGELLPHHTALCVRGRHLRAQLPWHQERQAGKVAAHCPLIAVLQSLVAAYAVTQSDEMWITELGLQ